MIGTDAERRGQVSAELADLDKAVEVLSQRISQVVTHLSRVLVADGDKIPSKGEPKEELVPLAHQVREVRQRIERQVERLENILARLEL